MSDQEPQGAAPTAVAVLDYLVRQIVDDPDGVRVTVDDGRDRLQLNVHVSDGDMGRVIGRRGRVANSIRTVVRAAAVRDDVEVDVEFVD
ncbi:MAG: KH domain-containing protein [Acidimicrobiales bacterium]